MSYIDQRNEWLSQHPDATVEQAWTAGYMKAVENWCKKKR